MDRQRFSAIKDRFEESRFRQCTTSFEWDTLLRTGPKRAIESVHRTPTTPPIPEWFLCKLAALLADPFNYQRKMVMPKEPMAILCHGDYLRNNIAFYYSTKSEGQVRNISITISRKCISQIGIKFHFGCTAWGWTALQTTVVFCFHLASGHLPFQTDWEHLFLFWTFFSLIFSFCLPSAATYWLDARPMLIRPTMTTNPFH